MSDGHRDTSTAYDADSPTRRITERVSPAVRRCARRDAFFPARTW
jgi:hypothetical protein